MKKEMLTYHDKVHSDSIFVTGTPQFTPYYDGRRKISRERFATEFNLPIDKKWICYSGDDSKTSPYDPVYLRHLAIEIQKANINEKENKHIIFT